MRSSHLRTQSTVSKAKYLSRYCKMTGRPHSQPPQVVLAHTAMPSFFSGSQASSEPVPGPAP